MNNTQELAPADLELMPESPTAAAKPELAEDQKTVITQVTALSTKSAILINTLIKELEQEKQARKDLQKEILELKNIAEM